MDNAMECSAWHDVDEQTGDFIQGMEDQRVSPQNNSDGIVAKSQAVCADEQSLAVGEEPNGKNKEQIDEIAEIGQEVVIADLVIFVPSDGHEVGELGRVPIVEVLGPCADEVARKKDV